MKRCVVTWTVPHRGPSLRFFGSTPSFEPHPLVPTDSRWSRRGSSRTPVVCVTLVPKGFLTREVETPGLGPPVWSRHPVRPRINGSIVHTPSGRRVVSPRTDQRGDESKGRTMTWVVTRLVSCLTDTEGGGVTTLPLLGQKESLEEVVGNHPSRTEIGRVVHAEPPSLLKVISRPSRKRPGPSVSAASPTPPLSSLGESLVFRMGPKGEV